MSRFHRLLVVVAVLSTVLAFASVRPAAAGTGVTIGCNTVDISLSPFGGPVPPSIPIVDITTSSIVGSISFVLDGSTLIGHGTFSAPQGHILQTVLTIFSVPPCGSGGTTWFSPGDSRVSAAAGDRIAVYCNTNPDGANPNTIGILGILDDGTGVPLALVKYSDLVKVGGKGLTISAGANGSVMISLTGPNNFYVKWLGGSTDASGYGDFKKRFSCAFK